MSANIRKLETSRDVQQKCIVALLEQALETAKAGGYDFIILLSQPAGECSLQWSHSSIDEAQRLLTLLGAMHVAEHAILGEAAVP